MKYVFLGILVVAVVSLTGMFLVNRSSPSPSPATLSLTDEVPAPTSGSDTISPAATAVRTVNIEAGSFYYDPKEITVKKGEVVRIVLTAKDMMHNFNLDEFSVESATVKAGETTTFEFTPDKVGEFEYYCSVGQHRANGQVGTLIVEE